MPGKDFSQRAGAGMTVAAWLLLLLFLAWLFNGQLEQRQNPNQQVDSTVVGGVREVRLQRNAFGHYLANGRINGLPVTFLLDTGASDIAIPEAIARKLDLPPGPQVRVQTANGIAIAERTRVQSITLGDITLSDLPATIMHNYPSDEVLLGMAFLKRLELIQKGETLTLRQY